MKKKKRWSGKGCFGTGSCPPFQSLFHPCVMAAVYSLSSKRFRGCGGVGNGISTFCPREKLVRETNRGIGGGEGERGNLPLPHSLFRFLALAPFYARAKHRNPVPRSFFAPKPHGNACYAG